MKVPFVDLGLQHRQIERQILAGWESVLDRTAFINGPEVSTFESAFADYMGVSHCVGVGSGTDALELALRALGIGPGHEVVLPANSFIASALAVVRAGATPVLVDVDGHYLIDVDHAAAACTDRTKAIMPVHLYGQLAEMERIREVKEAKDLVVVEDAAQAQGARRNGQSPGYSSEAAATSFYPGKNIGAYGDGGAVLSNSESLAMKVRALGNWGGVNKYQHDEKGFNSRLDTLQAVVLAAKLQHLESWNAGRRAAAVRYADLFEDVEQIGLPQTLPGNEHVWHLFVVRVPDRDYVMKALQAEGIGVGIHYPIPIHLQPAMSDLGYTIGDFPVAEKAAGEILSLPMFPGITPAQQEVVAEALIRAVSI